MAVTVPYLGPGMKRDTYENQMFRYLTTLIPHKLKSLFRLCEQVFTGPYASAGIRKIAEYPITDPELFSDNKDETAKMKDLLKDTFQINRELTISMYNLFVYGNDFMSFQESFQRYVTCRKCGARVNIDSIPKLTYHYKDVAVKYKCTECKAHTHSGFEDRVNKDVKKCTIVHWSPKRISIDHNPVNKQSKYYYCPSPEMTSRVQRGDRHLISTLPLAGS